MKRPMGMKLNNKTEMKRITLSISFALASIFAYAQTNVAADLAKQAQCDAIKAEMEPLLKASEHAKRGLKSSTWDKLGDAYINSQTQCGQDSTAADKAYAAYKKAAELEGPDGKNIEDIKAKLNGATLGNAFMTQGVAFYNVQNMKAAQHGFLKALEVNPTDTLASFYAGIVSNQLGDDENTEMAFAKYLELGGTDPAVYFSLGTKAQENEDFDTAVKYLKEGIEKNPADKDLKSALINLYLSFNKLDAAIVDLEKLVETDPTNTINLLNLGILYDNKGEAEKALMYYNKVLAIDPDNYDTNFNLGVYYFNKAVNTKKEIDNMSMDEYRKRGKDLETQVCKEFKEAQPYFQACDRAKPGDVEAGKQLETLKNVLTQCE
ncbi:Tetratricopeptide repeat-containing protein [Spirosomataceae bacterium TFI 002]|nr:Tetratricopeptide repeat-containing protein [Spirosomataceae bacterium TFI 002]